MVEITLIEMSNLEFSQEEEEEEVDDRQRS